MRLNSIDIDFAIDTLKHPSYGKASKIEKALEIAIKVLTIYKEMLGQTESYEIVKDKTTGIMIDKYEEWYQDYYCPNCMYDEVVNVDDIKHISETIKASSNEEELIDIIVDKYNNKHNKDSYN